MMFVVTSNPLVLPLIMLIWAIDIYMLLVSLRLILGQLSATRSSILCKALRELVDPIPNRVGEWLTACRSRKSPPWAQWVIVLGVGLVARYVLSSLVFSMCQT